MSALESERHALRENLAETLGPDTAGKLMEHLPPVSWDKLATKDDLAEMADKLATKDDLAALADKMATKDDLKSLATKDELKSLATKDELRDLSDKMATKDDLRVFGKELRAEMRDGFATAKTQSSEHLQSITATMIGHHRMTMLTLVGMAISIIVVLVISSPA